MLPNQENFDWSVIAEDETRCYIIIVMIVVANIPVWGYNVLRIECHPSL